MLELNKEIYKHRNIRDMMERAESLYKATGIHHTVLSNKSVEITCVVKTQEIKEMNPRWIPIFDTEKGELLK